MSATGEEPGPAITLDLAPANALLVIAIHEGLAYVRKARLLTPVDETVRGAARARLTGLRTRVVAGLGVVEGYRELTEIFDPEGSHGPGALSPGQLNAIATLAMHKWTARRGRPSLERGIDLRRVSAVSGRDPATAGDEYALRFSQGELVLRIERDLSVGRGRVIHSGQLVCRTLALSGPALEWIAWTFAGLDSLEGDARQLLREHARRLIALPWYDAQRTAPPVLAKLTAIADADGASAAAVRELLDRQPGSGR
jgi:hypothetical protein